jgi:hypothetical protein
MIVVHPRHRISELTRFNYDRLTWRVTGEEEGFATESQLTNNNVFFTFPL